MRRSVFLFVLPWLCLPVAAQVGSPAKVDVAKVRAKLLDAAYIEGRLTQIDEGESRFTFQYTHQGKKKANPKEQARLADISRRFNAALLQRSTSLETLRKMQVEGRAALKAAYAVEETPILFELKGEKNLALRQLLPPAGPNGKPRRLTPAEQKEMRRLPLVPGYPIAPKSLNTEARVRVYLDRAKVRAAAKDGDQAVFPLLGIVIVPEPKENDPFAIPGE